MKSLDYRDWYKLEELVRHHAKSTDKAILVLQVLKQFESDIWMTDDLLGLVAYIHLPIEVDMIVAMHWDNKFTKSQWKKVIGLINNRTKEVHINSDPTNKAIDRLAKKLGGYWIKDDLIFELEKG